MSLVSRLLVDVIILNFLLLPSEIKAQYDGDVCDFTKGGSGRCKLLDKCQPVYRDLLAGISPDTLCGFSGYDPIVCCPSAPAATATIPATTSLPTFMNKSFVIAHEITSRKPTSYPSSTTSSSTGKPGHLASQKCAEYATSIYALVKPPILSVDRKPVNISLCAIKVKKFIVGGTRADPKEFPHMTAVGFISKNDDENDGIIIWLCGGTLVSDKFVMTAAHCTYSPQFGNAAWVRVGDLNLARKDEDARPQERRIIERLRNPAYKKPAEYHDIALLRLESRVIFDAYVRPACLPVSRRIGNENVIATGWGRVNWADEDGSNDLLKVTLSTVSQEHCNVSFGGGGDGTIDYKLKRGIIDEWQICAGQEGRDTCQGDSGGPIVVFDKNHECMYDVVGITSLGRLCGSIVPGVYTRVYNYISWLENTIWG